MGSQALGLTPVREADPLGISEPWKLTAGSENKAHTGGLSSGSPQSGIKSLVGSISPTLVDPKSVRGPVAESASSRLPVWSLLLEGAGLLVYRGPKKSLHSSEATGPLSCSDNGSNLPTSV